MALVSQFTAVEYLSHKGVEPLIKAEYALCCLSYLLSGKFVDISLMCVCVFVCVSKYCHSSANDTKETTK